MKKYKFVLTGGDLRLNELACLLHSDGHEVCTFALENTNSMTSRGDICASDVGTYIRLNNMKDALARGDIIIGPIPLSLDGETLNSPLHSAIIPLEEYMRSIPKDRIFISGRISEYMENIAQQRNITVYDILKRNDMAILNAIPTAEGAIQIAMEELPLTIHGMNIAVFGYGRVGSVLAQKLHAMSSDVSIIARKSEDIARAESLGIKGYLYSDMIPLLHHCKLVYNTVPAAVINKHVIDALPKDCLIIDLASIPGGIEASAAVKKDIKVIHALSLPGKVAPVSAAVNMYKVIYNILKEDGLCSQVKG